ncbi:hypothetical protein BHE74_00012792 [Ensete ventricosum]|nr:hypothetical protein GW17_00011743 [Ensete ventricosum]RWW78948.1 hypothetical protein BHE74_00012792 [Ensete ventricosum]
MMRFPIVEPDSEHTKLRLAREGLEAIQRITTPIAAVAVSNKVKEIETLIRVVFNGLSYVFLKTFAIRFDVVNQVNQIRDSLAIMGDNSTAFSLPQVNFALEGGRRRLRRRTGGRGEEEEENEKKKQRTRRGGGDDEGMKRRRRERDEDEEERTQFSF